MTKLMRENLARLYPDFRTAHAGLLIQRGLREWDDDNEKPIKKELIDDRISSVKADELYLLAFHRWLNLTQQDKKFANLSAKINGRLFIGLALGQTLETGAMTHHTYGMPMIAGSSIKGAVRHYTEQLFAERDENNNIRYRDKQIVIQANKKHILDILFGTDDSSNAGYLIWHDAWWIAPVGSDMKPLQGENARPFIGEIVTVHHQEYYQGKMKEALDIESPIPNQQIAIQGEFYFSIEGEQQWAEFAKMLLTKMLQEQGVGAKGSNGYGYFEIDDNLDRKIAERFNSIKPMDKNDPLAHIKKEIRRVAEKDLPNQLSKNKNKLFKKLELDKDNEDDCKKVALAFIEELGQAIEEWSNAPKGSNALKSYEFIEQYR